MIRPMLGFTALFVPLAVLVGVSQGNVSTLSGHVKDDKGQVMYGVLVGAKDGAGKTVTVPSKFDGTFTITGLAPGTYEVRAQRRGYVSTPQRIELPASRAVSFTLQPGPIDRFDLALGELHKLLPESPQKKQVLSARCTICHNWSVMAARRNRAGVNFWISGLRKMNQVGLANFPPDELPKIAEYLEANFGPDSKLYAQQLPPEQVDEASLNIRYVTYDIPTRNAKPHTARPDGEGNVWFAEMGGGKIGVLNVKSGKIDEFRIDHHPFPRAHGLTLDRFGNVWFTAQGAGTIGRFDPRTRTFKHYRVPPPKNPLDEYYNYSGARSQRKGAVEPHTLLADPDGNIWYTGSANEHITKLNPKTEEYTEYVVHEGGGRIYTVERDPKTGRIWYAGMGFSEVGYIEPATGKVTKFPLLTPDAGPRRLKIDSKGVAWCNEYNVSKIARIDPVTRQVKEWNLPGARDGSPYPFGIDSKDRIWTQTARDDRLHMFDPKTERFTTYLMPYKGNALRDFFLDEEGTLWAGTYDHDQIIGFKLEEGR